tara:strand:- start:847 stop:1449 length:603 start_codon:yes stop_codon:yes gene_type:complete
MVKNKTGGKNAKKGARKNLNAEIAVVRHLRVVENDGEMYGIVTKMLGNGQVELLCNDQKCRLCIIRYKFSGRNKSSNIISVGSWVIVGLRDWETTKPGKLQKCDLLEIYTHQERSKLIQECKQNLSVLLNHERSNEAGGGGGNNEDEQGIVFSTIDDVEGGGGDEACAMENNTGGGDAINTDEAGNGGSHMDDEIDFDEI